MIKTFIKKYQKIITIFFFVFLVLIIWIFPKSQKPIAFPTPTPLPIKFEIRRTIPSSGVGAQILQTSAIEFIFSKQIDLSSLVIIVNPHVEFNFEYDKDLRTLFIRALPYWEYNKEYEISIDVRSKENESLDNKIEYKLKINKFTNSNMEEVFLTPIPEF